MDTVNDVISDWYFKKLELDKAKLAEMQARKLVVSALHDPTKRGTVETTELGSGYKLKLKVPIYYNFVKNGEGKADTDKIIAIIEKIDNSDLVRWKPELSITEYNKLNSAHRAIVDEVLISSEGAPTLEIVEPK